MNWKKIGTWALQIIPALILLQTLPFKLLGIEESRLLFEALGAEPWGRYLSAVVELVAIVLLLMPKTARFGGILTSVLMLGAIGLHVVGPLGINYGGDPTLFIMAIIALVTSIGAAVMRWPKK